MALISKGDVRIVLVGKTGSGKSTSGNTVLNKDVFKKECSSKPVTMDFEKHEATVHGRKVLVVDSPGLFGTSGTEKTINIEKCVEMSVPGPHVFLLVIRLGRFTDEEKKAVKWIQENFGEDAVKYTIILFTNADDLENKSLDRYLKENEELQKLTKQYGGRYHSFNNKSRGNQSQVTELLQKIDEMVKNYGESHYTNEMYKEMQRKIQQRRLQIAALVAAGGAVGAAVAAGPAATLAAGATAIQFAMKKF